jgi:hypothetical protein
MTREERSQSLSELKPAHIDEAMRLEWSGHDMARGPARPPGSVVVMVVGVRKRVIVPMMRVLCRSVIVVAAMGAGVRIVHVVDMTGRRHRRRFGFLKRITPTAIANSCQQRYPTRVINFIQTRILITHHSRRRAGCRNSTKGSLCSACARWRLIEVAHDIG